MITRKRTASNSNLFRENLQPESPKFAQIFLDHFIAEVATFCTIAPLDRAKIIYQTQSISPLSASKSYSNYLDAVKVVINEPGYKPAFKGTIASILKLIPR